jgi:hypothetical protein
MSLERFGARLRVGGRPGWFRGAVRLAGRAAATTAVLATIPASSWGGTANAGLPGASKTNPLAGMQWGIYHGPIDGVYPAYQSAPWVDNNSGAFVFSRALQLAVSTPF